MMQKFRDLFHRMRAIMFVAIFGEAKGRRKIHYYPAPTRKWGR